MLAMFRALDCAQNEHEGVRISRHYQRDLDTHPPETREHFGMRVVFECTLLLWQRKS